MIKTRSVSAIKNGVVIDHIPPGQSLKIMRLLHVINGKQRVTLGLNLRSTSLKLKDLIKIENRLLTSGEVDHVAVFAPGATINRIKNFKVSHKIKCELPHVIRDILVCPNLNCITHVEKKSYFELEGSSNQFKLRCFYCEKLFERGEVEEICL
ncbi:aspartate carbamoyltransferase regulatory subunit [Rickettsiella grylli]|uniref:Aspartate carbamoyltransferase regulatory chain n=1 Tax=Rickettsiella grylli TaxID=59196 RepID=A8PKY7_9COXI|nr:aspartate carbamoyltransferase regulatory subunit [Rickettsiella grylli]EDP46011.1 aspartate carbamoyltransferase, regulatory subunit [Rickettsiella grylli]